MNPPHFSFRARLRRVAGLVLLLALPLAGLCTDLGLPEKSPAALGFSAARLERIPGLLQREITAQHYAGAVWLVARDGAIVSHGALGWGDAPGQVAMTEDAVFKIFSMTKIVTTVTALTLLEEGKINLDDPVEKYLPELAKRQVLVGGTPEAPQLEPAKGPITIRHLLTQTSGIPYDIFATGTLRTLWSNAGLWQSRTLKEFVTKVAALPLAHQPGTRWTYGVNTDLLGAVIEVVTGQDLETAMRERVLAPLGMTHTTFRPDPALLARLAKIHHRTAAGPLAADESTNQVGNTAFPSGGGGLYSTLHDYARFGQMLLNGGQLGGVRILGRKTVEMMTSNQVMHLDMNRPGVPAGFGFGVKVRPVDAHAAGSLGATGEFGWNGLATTYVSMNPQDHVLLLMLMQHAPWNEDAIFDKFANTAYQALEK